MTVALPAALEADFEALAGGALEQPPEWLGARYEARRRGSLERRKGGAHYTPSELIKPIIGATLEPVLDRVPRLFVTWELLEFQQGPPREIDDYNR